MVVCAWAIEPGILKLIIYNCYRRPV